MANAGERQSVVPHGADHEFRLPKPAPRYAAASVKGVQPGEADDVSGRRSRKWPRFVGCSEQKAERWRERSEFRGSHECEIHLQRARQQKDAIRPQARLDIQVVRRPMPVVHLPRPVGENAGQVGISGDGECEIDIRPAVFAFYRARAGDSGADDARVSARLFDKLGTQSSSLFRCEHEFSNSMPAASMPQWD